MSSSQIPGHPTPILDPNQHEVRADPDEENPHELVLDASQVNAGLPPLPHTTRAGDRDGDGDEDRD